MGWEVEAGGGGIVMEMGRGGYGMWKSRRVDQEENKSLENKKKRNKRKEY